MTGAGEGKLLLDAEVYLAEGGGLRRVPCEVYLHVRGYSRARVTHIDLEADILNSHVAPGERFHGWLRVSGDCIRIGVFRAAVARTAGLGGLLLCSKELADCVRSSGSRYVLVGGKVGGAFLGFKRDVLYRLERLAEDKGVSPPRRL